MSNVINVDANAFFAAVEADPEFFQGPGGGGGGGGWSQPTVVNAIAGFTHRYWVDGNGNQKHTVTDANGNTIQASASAFVIEGTQATVRWRGSGYVTDSTSVALDKAKMPPGAPPWKVTQSGGTITGHANNSATATGNDVGGSPYSVTYAGQGGSTASVSCAIAAGSGSWTLPLYGGAVDFQLDLWALWMLIVAALVALFAFIEIPIWVVILLFLMVLAGTAWLVSKW